jgi:hypothetical protein
MESGTLDENEIHFQLRLSYGEGRGDVNAQSAVRYDLNLETTSPQANRWRQP